MGFHLAAGKAIKLIAPKWIGVRRDAASIQSGKQS
jgi:hypothetical protein